MIQRSVKYLYLLLLLLVSINAEAQIGKTFWFAAPDLNINHAQAPISLNFVTYDEAASIKIYQPANASFAPINITVAANSGYKLNLSSFVSAVECTPINTVLNKAIKIESTSAISAYYAETFQNSEIYSLKGENALGTDFMVGMQSTLGNYSKTDYTTYSSVEILATEDNTQVIITPAAACTSHAAGVAFTVTLNHGQTYTIRASSPTAAGHLGGTRIKSTKPIAVNSSDDSVIYSGALGVYYDLVGEQLVPISLLGSDYIAVTNGGVVEDIYIRPVENNTPIYINGTYVATLNSGKLQKYSVNGVKSVYISSKDENKPLVVFQLTTTSMGEEGGTLLPKVGCTGSKDMSYLCVLNRSFIASIVVRTAAIGNFSLANSSTSISASDFNSVPGFSGWSYCRKEITPTNASKPVRIKNTSNIGYFQISAMEASGSTCSYGYFTDYQKFALNVSMDKGFYISGDNIHLSITGDSNFTNIKWTGPKGWTSTSANPIISNVDSTWSGLYTVSATHILGCDVKTESIYIDIINPRVTYDTICKGSSVQINSSGFAPYKWTPATGLSSTTIKNPIANPTVTTTYLCQTSREGHNLIVNGDFESGNVGFSSDYSYVTTVPNSLVPESVYTVGISPNLYHYSFGQLYDHTKGNNTGKHMIVNGSSVDGTRVWYSTINVMPNTNYVFYTWLAQIPRSINDAKLKFSINNVQLGDLMTAKQGVWQQFYYIWNSGSNTTANISIVNKNTSDGGNDFCLDDIHFAPLLTITDTAHVVVTELTKPVIPNISDCTNTPISVDAGGGYDSYVWNTGETTQTITVTKATAGVYTYTVIVTKGGCSATATVTLTIKNETEKPKIGYNIN